jgi:RNA polymerase sigma factor for flagellar operon FliA
VNITQRLAGYRKARNAVDGDEPLIDGMTRYQLIEKHSRKVSYIARRICQRLPDHATVDLDDLVSVGSLGLLDALDKFDPSKETSFGTYVEFRIKGSILDHLRSLDPASRTVREKANRLQRTIRDLELQLRRPPETSEIAEALDMTMPQYNKMLDEVKSNTLVSFDAPRTAGDDGSSGTLGDTIPGGGFAAPDEALSKREAIEHLAAAIETSLPERHQRILSMYYERQMSMKEIGAVLGVTESRVCQLHSESCARLRGALADSLRPGERFPKKKARK